MRRIRLGVNIDHVATLRQARGTRYPDPVLAAALVELAGADQVTVHLREDRRHIQDRDLRILRQTIQTSLNLEMASSEEVIAIACEVRPDMATLVPEKREERTTEGGLQVLGREEEVAAVVRRLHAAGIRVSLFLNPDPESVRVAAQMGCEQVEITRASTRTPTIAAGKSHSCDTPTIRSVSPRAHRTSVALGRREAMRMGEVLCVVSGGLCQPPHRLGIGRGRMPSVYIETYGCQMNLADTELMRGHLARSG
jgi:pyridoxine 5'-phosphate synthase